MNNLYFCGGFAGSFLCADMAGLDVVWVSAVELLLGKVRQLVLAPNGVDPEPPDGRTLFSSVPYPDYYLSPVVMLAEALGPHGYLVLNHGFDFRMKLRSEGKKLADRIRRDSGSVGPATIVGHSQGGLLARCAWADLVGTGEQGLVRRIITLGTPHFGSYNIVGLLTGNDDSALGVALLDALGNAAWSLLPLYFGKKPLGPVGVAKIAQTWPGSYELLPSLPVPQAIADDLRILLYDSQNWPSAARPPQEWLDYAANDWQPFLRSAASIPPARVLTSVVSSGFPTAETLLIGQSFGSRASFGYTDAGDSLVTTRSAILPNTRVFETMGIHYDLTRSMVLSGDLVKLVLEERPPPPPPPGPPPPVWINSPVFAAPPMPGGISGNADC